MRRYCILLVFCAVACNSKDKEAATAPAPAPEAVPGAKYSADFGRVLDGMLANYNDLLAAFAKGDTAAVGAAGRTLDHAFEGLSFNEFKTDTLVYQTAVGKMSDTRTELKGLLGEPTLSGRRNELNMVSQDLYDLLRTINYAGKTLYLTECGTALANEQSGDWISPINDSTGANPYTGTPGCAQVKDSIGARH